MSTLWLTSARRDPGAEGAAEGGQGTSCGGSLAPLMGLVPGSGPGGQGGQGQQGDQGEGRGEGGGGIEASETRDTEKVSSTGVRKLAVYGRCAGAVMSQDEDTFGPGIWGGPGGCLTGRLLHPTPAETAPPSRPCTHSPMVRERTEAHKEDLSGEGQNRVPCAPLSLPFMTVDSPGAPQKGFAPGAVSGRGSVSRQGREAPHCSLGSPQHVARLFLPPN